MICKEDVFEFLNIIRDMYGKVPIKYIEKILNILERDSGKIWSKELKIECYRGNSSLEEIWKKILNSPKNPDDPYCINQ